MSSAQSYWSKNKNSRWLEGWDEIRPAIALNSFPKLPAWSYQQVSWLSTSWPTPFQCGPRRGKTTFYRAWFKKITKPGSTKHPFLLFWLERWILLLCGFSCALLHPWKWASLQQTFKSQNQGPSLPTQNSAPNLQEVHAWIFVVWGMI